MKEGMNQDKIQELNKSLVLNFNSRGRGVFQSTSFEIIRFK